MYHDKEVFLQVYPFWQLFSSFRWKSFVCFFLTIYPTFLPSRYRINMFLMKRVFRNWRFLGKFGTLLFTRKEQLDILLCKETWTTLLASVVSSLSKRSLMFFQKGFDKLLILKCSRYSCLMQNWLATLFG